MAGSNQNPLRLPENRDELIARAIAADDACVSVGGLAAQLGMLWDAGQTRAARRAGTGHTAAPLSLGLQALARLVQLDRRRLRLSSEQFAAQCGLELHELLDVESAQAPPEPRVLYQLSMSLKVSYEKLLTLAGHRQRRDEALERGVLLFAANSGPMDQLSKSESQALQDFIRALNDEGPRRADEHVSQPEDR